VRKPPDVEPSKSFSHTASHFLCIPHLSGGGQFPPYKYFEGIEGDFPGGSELPMRKTSWVLFKDPLPFSEFEYR